MFLVEVDTVLAAIGTVQSIVGAATGLIVYQAALTLLWLLTVLFAGFAEALAEARGKAQPAVCERPATHRPPGWTTWTRKTASRALDQAAQRRPRAAETGEVIPTDGEVVAGVAAVDESTITGERRRDREAAATGRP